MRKFYFLLVMTILSLVAHAQSFEGFAIGSSYDDIKPKIPENAIIKNNDPIVGATRIIFKITSLDTSGDLTLFVYKNTIVSATRKYPLKLLSRVTNALIYNYGNSIYKGSYYWRQNGVDIYIFELEEDFILSYDLKTGIGMQYYDLLLNGASRTEDSIHF